MRRPLIAGSACNTGHPETLETLNPIQCAAPCGALGKAQAASVPGIGRITGTCWSFTDFVFGAPPPLSSRSLYATQATLRPWKP